MILIKVGGGGEINLPGVARGVAGLDEAVILVHGANALRRELADRLGSEIRTVTSVSGYSSVLSDQETVDLMMMTYAGLRNKRFVEVLQQHGVDAVGLTGLDGRAVQARRNRGIRVQENGRRRLMRDLSGRAEKVNRRFLDLLLENGFTPVLTMPLIDEHYTAVNSENDDVVTVLQGTYQAHTVIHLIEAPGLLADSGDVGSHIPRLSSAELGAWEERATGRLRRKLRAIQAIFDVAPARVLIGDGRTENPVRDALEGRGTVIQ